VPRTPDPRIAFSNARVSSRLCRRAAVHTHCRQATKLTSSDSMLGVYTLYVVPSSRATNGVTPAAISRVCLRSTRGEPVAKVLTLLES
jgi:hypothetical protein